MKRHAFLLAWLLFHGVIFAAFLVSLALSPRITFATSLFDILPPSSSLREVQAADSALSDRTGRAVTVLVRSQSFGAAKKAAERLYERYAASGTANSAFFDALSLYVGSEASDEIAGWLHENRFALLGGADVELLEGGGVAELSSDALSSVYGAFALSDLSRLSEDPFLLSERSLRRLLGSGAVSGTNMALKDGVLACEKGGAWYVLVRGTVSERGAALASKKSTVRSLYEASEEIRRSSAEEVDFVFSGVPFHSYESSTSAQSQISVISTVALALIVLVFLWLFRSPVPALVSACAVVFSCAAGFVATLLFFRGIHVLTFVFGTTLIGTCLDYSIHYFVNWKANAACGSGTAVRSHILRGITLGFASTEICFAALFLAPFPLLKQVSVFLFTGLATAYLSVVALYPLLSMPKAKSESLGLARLVRALPEAKIGAQAGRGGAGRFCLARFVPLVLVAASVVIILTNNRSFKIQNNIQELYSMSPRMLQNEITTAEVLNTSSSGWYFIVKAESEEALLQKTEELGAFLDENVAAGKLGSYLSVAQFIPSERRQARSFRAAGNLLPIVREQYEAVGFDAESLSVQYEKNYRSLEGHFVHAEDADLPLAIRDAIANLWIGEHEGAFYSCVLPLHAKGEEEAFFRAFAERTEGIFFVNKVKDISSQLDILSWSMLLMLAVAFVVVIVILFFCYAPRLVLKIAVIPPTVTLVTTAVLLLCGIHLSFFPITALVLVFGLGLDYIIYAIEGSERRKAGQTNGSSGNLNSFAILLSFVTTALSFGALALSTFPPVHMLGVTVFVGLLTAVVSAFCVTKED